MSTIDAIEAMKLFETLLDRVEMGREFLITRHGKPIARLIKDDPIVREQEALAAMERIRQRGAGLQLGPFDWEEIKKDRDEGRP